MRASLTIGLQSTLLFLSLGLTFAGCARLPETTRVLHEDDRVAVRLETDLDAPLKAYTSPTELSQEHILTLLRGYSVRVESRAPVRLLVDDTPPRKLFREMELTALAPVLREALQTVGFRERVRFEVVSPGRNPRYWRDVTGGWIKVRDHYLHLHIDYFHAEQPIRKADAYDRNYPSPWTPEKTYSVYFEPGRFYRIDPLLNDSAVDLNLLTGATSP
ncbi:hypothetical protein [Nitrospira lenta]|nr:hypothetical protein [Nitrospira lenta]